MAIDISQALKYGDDVAIVSIDTDGNFNYTPNLNTNVYAIAIAPDSDVDLATFLHQDLVGNYLNSTLGVGSPYLGKIECIANNSANLLNFQYAATSSPRYFQDPAISAWFTGGGVLSQYSWNPEALTQLPQLKLLVYQRKPRNLLGLNRLPSTLARSFTGNGPGATTVYFRLPVYGRRSFYYNNTLNGAPGSAGLTGNQFVYGVNFNRSGIGNIDLVRRQFLITSGGNLNNINFDSFEFDALEIEFQTTTATAVSTMWTLGAQD